MLIKTIILPKKIATGTAYACLMQCFFGKMKMDLITYLLEYI